MAMPRNLEIFCGSWNMGNAMAEGLEEFVPAKGGNYDLVAIGLQESTYKVDASVKATSSQIDSSSKDATTHTFQENMEKAFDPSIAHLTSRICAILGSDFYMVDHANRYQMQLLIFARTKLQRSIQHIEKTVENTGILGILPNKGGLCICFTVDSTKLAFISSHLAAHEGTKKCGLRNDHVKEILGGVRAGDKRFDVTVQFHHVFFMGDMNYRLALPSASTGTDAFSVTRTKPSASASTGVATQGVKDDDDEDEEEHASSHGDKDQERTLFEEQIYRALSERRWNDLVHYDELSREINAGRVLPGFTCALPRFPPTFKRTRKLCLPMDITKLSMSELKGFYDTKRLPAYTDRILYRSLPGFTENLQLLSFECCEAVTSSDHKPIKSSFELITTVDGDILNDPAGSKSKLELDISNLKGQDLAEMDVKVMGMGGGSDPYIVIHTDPPSVLIGDHNTPGIVKSRTIMHDLNPDWGKDVLHLKLNTHDVGGLSRNAHLMISVWDYDRFNEDDLIGVCSLPLKTLLGQLAVNYKKSTGQGFTFREPLHSNGDINGYLSGTITLSSAIASKSDMQTQLIEHAGRYTDSLAEQGTDEHGNGTWNDASGVPITSQKRPHPSLANRRASQNMSMMSMPIVTDSHLSAMRVEASLRANPHDNSNHNPQRQPSSSSHSDLNSGLPAVPPVSSSPPPTTSTFPIPTPPTPPHPPIDDGTIDIGPRKLSLKIGDKELVARTKKDQGERPPLSATPPSGGPVAAGPPPSIPVFPQSNVSSSAPHSTPPTIASAPGQGLGGGGVPAAAGTRASPGTRASRNAPAADGKGGCCVVA